MTELASRVYAKLKLIPIGKVTTYQALAKAAGNAKAVRAVGTILGHNPNLIVVPCHRVVKSDGAVCQYAGGVEKKIKLLESEGIEVVNNKIDLKKFGYWF